MFLLMKGLIPMKALKIEGLRKTAKVVKWVCWRIFENFFKFLKPFAFLNRN